MLRQKQATSEKSEKIGTAARNEEQRAWFGWRWWPLPWSSKILVLKGGKYVHFDKCFYFYSVSSKSLISHIIKVKALSIHQNTLFRLHFKNWNKQECYKIIPVKPTAFIEDICCGLDTYFPIDLHGKTLITRLGCCGRLMTFKRSSWTN